MILLWSRVASSITSAAYSVPKRRRRPSCRSGCVFLFLSFASCAADDVCMYYMIPVIIKNGSEASPFLPSSRFLLLPPHTRQKADNVQRIQAGDSPLPEDEDPGSFKVSISILILTLRCAGSRAAFAFGFTAHHEANQQLLRAD